MHEISIISLAAVAVLLLGCLYLILAPLFHWDSFLGAGIQTNNGSRMKESLLSTLNEIEFEYKMDKLSAADYKSLKKQYEAQIAAIIKEEEQPVNKKVDRDVMAEVEKEIAAALKSYRQKKGEGK